MFRPSRHCLWAVNRSFCTSPVCREIIRYHGVDDFVKKVFVENDKPVVVNFHAAWFEPSNSVKKRLEAELGTRFGLGLAIINVEDYMDLVRTFNIKAVPTVMGIRNGLVVQKITGIINNDVLDELIKHISATKDQQQIKKTEELNKDNDKA